MISIVSIIAMLTTIRKHKVRSPAHDGRAAEARRTNSSHVQPPTSNKAPRRRVAELCYLRPPADTSHNDGPEEQAPKLFTAQLGSIA